MSFESGTLKRPRAAVSEAGNFAPALPDDGPSSINRKRCRANRAVTARSDCMRRDGSAALNLCYLACGRFDGFWEASLAPWDMAAGTLLVREAGGLVTGYEGGDFRLDGRQILASNGRIHEEMRTVLGRARGAAGG